MDFFRNIIKKELGDFFTDEENDEAAKSPPVNQQVPT